MKFNLLITLFITLYASGSFCIGEDAFREEVNLSFQGIAHKFPDGSTTNRIVPDNLQRIISHYARELSFSHVNGVNSMSYAVSFGDIEIRGQLQSAERDLLDFIPLASFALAKTIGEHYPLDSPALEILKTCNERANEALVDAASQLNEAAFLLALQAGGDINRVADRVLESICGEDFQVRRERGRIFEHMLSSGWNYREATRDTLPLKFAIRRYLEQGPMVDNPTNNYAHILPVTNGQNSQTGAIARRLIQLTRDMLWIDPLYSGQSLLHFLLGELKTKDYTPSQKGRALRLLQPEINGKSPILYCFENNTVLHLFCGLEWARPLCEKHQKSTFRNERDMILCCGDLFWAQIIFRSLWSIYQQQNHLENLGVIARENQDGTFGLLVGERPREGEDIFPYVLRCFQNIEFSYRIVYRTLSPILLEGPTRLGDVISYSITSDTLEILDPVPIHPMEQLF